MRRNAQRFEPLDKVAATAAAGLKIVLGEAAALPALKAAVAAEGGGRGQVSVVVPLDDIRRVEIALPGGFKVSPRLIGAIAAIPGIVEALEI